MTIDIDLLTRNFVRLSSKDKIYQRALQVVGGNSKGKIWLIGGYLYKTLTNILYGSGLRTKDYDFLVEEVRKDLIIPQGLDFSKSRFGGIKLRENPRGIVIDFLSLMEVYHIVSHGVKNPTIGDFINGTPLNIQSLAYDVQEQRILGSLGIRALEDKTIGVNDALSLEESARMYQTTPSEMVMMKAREMNFGFTLTA